MLLLLLQNPSKANKSKYNTETLKMYVPVAVDSLHFAQMCTIFTTYPQTNRHIPSRPCHRRHYCPITLTNYCAQNLVITNCRTFKVANFNGNKYNVARTKFHKNKHTQKLQNPCTLTEVRSFIPVSYLDTRNKTFNAQQ